MKSKEPKPEQEVAHVQLRDIAREMRESYLDYAMSVIVTRALPDVRDGLKPVHRRILYTMRGMGLRHTTKHRKSAAVVGDVLGKYHPHGDAPVYDALARMAQDFSMRYPLIDGQGNFGSIDGDSPAAMRYTEARMAALSDELLLDIDKETVDFMPNYDGTREEPTVFPARIPYLLLNGSLGIAVGMATNIPPHNLTELINAALTLIENPKATTEDLLEHIKGPDFPMGGIIFNKQDIHQAYSTGKGSIVARGEAEIIEKETGRGHAIIITSIPYQVNKAEMIEKMADLVREKKIDGIKDIRDESDKDGLRVAIELKNDAYPQKVLNNLYKHTDLEKVFHLNMLALVGGIQPQTLSLKHYFEEFVATRRIMVDRRTRHDLRIAEERAHILEGLKKALDHIDEIISTIKKSKDRESAHTNLMQKFKLSERQSTAILEMRLQTLAGLERKKIEDELAEKRAIIKDLKAILADPKKLLAVITKELIEIRDKYGDERRTKVVATGVSAMATEDLIPEEEQVVLMTQGGYLKRVRPQEFRAQRRGGKGTIGGEWKEEDVVSQFATANTHDSLLFFSSLGKVYELRVFEIPESSRTAKGRPVVNFLPLAAGEEITSFLSVPKKTKGEKDQALIMTTRKGIVKKTTFSSFAGVRKSGIIAMKLQKGDVLGWVRILDLGADIMLFSKKGQAIRFKEKQTGVEAIKLSDELVVDIASDGTVYGIELLNANEQLQREDKSG
ncbi:MAG: DNA gyrase subunit A, partial [Patescibacteria group bacterium]